MRRPPRGGAIQCDSCGAAFIPAPVEEPDGSGSVTLRFTCPRCGAVYPVARISQHGLSLRARLQQMARMGQAGKPQYNDLLARYRRQVTRLGPGSHADPVAGESRSP